MSPHAAFTERLLSNYKLAAVGNQHVATVVSVPVLRRIAECVLGRAPRDASVVVVHEPTAQFLGPGLLLGDRSDAVTFDDAQAAEVFLARHASEPAYAVVGAGDLDATAA